MPCIVLKQALDPLNILDPDKIVPAPAGWSGSYFSKRFQQHRTHRAMTFVGFMPGAPVQCSTCHKKIAMAADFINGPTVTLCVSPNDSSD
jgi:hypothetical protein